MIIHYIDVLRFVYYLILHGLIMYLKKAKCKKLIFVQDR